MPVVLTVLLASVVGALGGGVGVWVVLRQTKDMEVEALRQRLVTTENELTQHKAEFAILQKHIHDPQQFQRRILLGISEVAHRLADLNLDVSGYIETHSDLPPFIE